MSPTPFHLPLRRTSATLLAFVIAIAVAAPALAQRKSPTDDGLADEPLNIKNSAKPNIMMTADNSGSMAWDYLPDAVIGRYCRTTSGAMTQACGTGNYVYTQSGFPFSGSPNPPRPALWAPSTRASAFNRIAYNPAVEYRPPRKADGSYYPQQDKTYTTNWTKVDTDIWLAPATKVSMNNLPAAAPSGKITVGRWCNSDYPVSLTSGDDCRVNGTAYAAGGNGAPAVAGDWNYPVQPTGFSATTSKPNAAYFHYTEYAVWCKTAGVSWATGSADAGGAGTNCRRNNQAYAAPPAAAALNNYPDATFKNRVSQGANTIPNVTDAPWQYWKTAVEWCSTAVTTTGDKWTGFGNTGCQSYPTTTYKYPRFYQFGAVPGTNNYAIATPAMERWDLDFNDPTRGGKGYVHNYVDALGDPQTVTRSFDVDTADVNSEMTNYANWFAYYRTRTLVAKTAASRAFGELDDAFRVGFATLNSPSTYFLNVADYTAGQKANWYAKLFAFVPSGNTPTVNAVLRIGEYFRSGTMPDVSGGVDPITLSCQKNWHMLFTDGYTNQTVAILASAATGVNVDGSVVPTLPEVVAGSDLTPGAAWPFKYREGTTAQSNTLADFATYYWMTDMNPGAGGTATNNVPASATDPASWQHVNFAALSFGTLGTLDISKQSATLSQIATGAIRWPKWVNNAPEAIDDLWHATVNARGRFVNAATPDELAMGLAQILQDITNQAGSRVGVAFTSVTLSGSDKYIYKVRFEPGWGGTLNKEEINPETGDETGVHAWCLPPPDETLCGAAAQLNRMLTATLTEPTPWLSNNPATARKVVTLNGATAVPFRWDNLSAAQQASLATTVKRQKAIVEFLRGNRVNEGVTLGQLRVRNGLLGDIVNSQAVYVGPPNKPYAAGIVKDAVTGIETCTGDLFDPGYCAYRNAMNTRVGRVFVGANDGMVHAIDDATGKEVWAFVPKALYRAGNGGLGGLSYQEGGVPIYRHHFYVDSTPRPADVKINGVWKTILVGGLGKGGNSYYALDVTSPGNPTTETETDIAKNVLWEFTDSDLGYTYGKPLLVKTYAHGWVMIVPSGYDNPSGVGKIFVVDLMTGTKLKEFTTGAGTPANPSGLAHISGYTKDYKNQYVEQVYGGDLFGNVWRFDLSNPDASLWSGSGQKLASLTDPGGTAQPVTTAPQIEVDISNGVDRWVFVGTGRLLDNGDLSNTQIQTMYAIRDGTASLAGTIGAPITRSTTGMAVVSNATGLGSRPDKGWYDDLPLGQRIIVPVQAEVSIVAYAGARPQTDPCETGQPATLYARGFGRGESRLQTSAGGAFVESIDIAEGVAGIEIVSLKKAGSTDANYIPDIRIGVTQLKDAKLVPYYLSLGGLTSLHRMSWRLIRD